MKTSENFGLDLGKYYLNLNDPFILEVFSGKGQKISSVRQNQGIIVPENWLEIRNEEGEVTQFVPGFVCMEGSSLQFALYKV